MIYNTQDFTRIFCAVMKDQNFGCHNWPSGCGWKVEVLPTGSNLIVSWEDADNFTKVEIRISLPVTDCIVTVNGEIISKANGEYAWSLARATGSRRVTVIDEKYGPPATYPL